MIKEMYKSNTPHCGTHCGVAKTIKIIGSKWTLMILHNIMEGNNRFGALQRELKGISTKTLSVRLQEMERDGIINRKVYAEVPLHVEYSLTKKGTSLKGIIDQMAQWGETAS
jgi:DNA-binding HxlR family transcriptional regulator